MRTITKLLVLFALLTLAGCNRTTADAASNTTETKPTRNLAIEFVLSEDKDAKCVVYHQHEGPKLTDSAKCELSNKHRVFVRVDVETTRVDRVDPPTPDELSAAAQADQAAHADQAKKGAKK